MSIGSSSDADERHASRKTFEGFNEILGDRLTVDEHALIGAAVSMVPILAGNAEEADTTRRLPENNIAALRDAGLLRLSVPRVYQGHAVSMRACLAILAELGAGCPSTAWVVALFYGGGVFGGLLGEKVQQRIWGANPDATVCGARGLPVPTRQVPGGYVLNGQWRSVSGVHHADWVVLDTTIEAEIGTEPQRGIAIVEVGQLSIRDTWHMAGMRGTGSDTVVAEDVYVPQEQMLSLAKSRSGEYRRDGPHDALTRLPPSATMVCLIGPLLGIGAAVYAYIVDKIKDGRPVISAARQHALAMDSPGVQAATADAAMLLDTAVLLAGRAAHDIDRFAQTDELADPLHNARLRMDISVAARNIRRAVDELLDVGGASRFDRASPMQRLWRDLGTATRHPAFTVEINRDLYGRLLLGLDTS
jgi:alkylation response protein AidB-like acyl-CoA dehydrogenase